LRRNRSALGKFVPQSSRERDRFSTVVDQHTNHTPRQRQIYIEAARLFVQKGFGGTSMSDLAEAVQITKAGLYHSITNKEDLLFTVIQFGMDGFEQQVVKPALEVSDPLARLKVAMRLHVLNTSRLGGPDGNPMTAVVDQVFGLSRERQELVAKRKFRYIAMLRDTLEELRAQQRLIESVDSTVAAHSITAMILGIPKWRRPDGRLSVEQISDQVVRMALRTVLKPDVLKAGPEVLPVTVDTPQDE